MGNKLNNNELKAIGILDAPLLKTIGILSKNLIKQKKYTKESIINVLIEILNRPGDYVENEIFNGLAKIIYEKNISVEIKKTNEFQLSTRPVTFEIFGADLIEKLAIDQMSVAMRLPITKSGSLMPDAHAGYGLPIGGVLATSPDVIIPYAIGVDIACRMCLSIFEMDGNFLEQKKSLLKNHLIENTYFGLDSENKNSIPDTIFDLPGWKETPLIKKLRYKAERQLGTSGSGNHFVEWGLLEILNEDKILKIPKGKYLALLSHSGSRGFGAGVANYYSKIAMEKTKLPKEARHMAWLDLNSEEGAEYWIAMNLAGDYASACHHQIHKKLAKAIGAKPLKMVENHHNFAWKETLDDGSEAIVHRKGSTPAGVGILGIIPGSMAQSGYVVKGKGNGNSINSASHGAGRSMSRSKAFNNLSKAEMKKLLSAKGIILSGGDIDEAPMAYKNIDAVMAAQNNLVEVIATFTPKIVRMADADKRGGGGWEK